MVSFCFLLSFRVPRERCVVWLYYIEFIMMHFCGSHMLLASTNFLHSVLALTKFFFGPLLILIFAGGRSDYDYGRQGGRGGYGGPPYGGGGGTHIIFM